MKDLKERYLQLITASLLALAGVALLFVGTLLAPQGEIHETVLVAFGEVATFAGSIIGIDYHCRGGPRVRSVKTANGHERNGVTERTHGPHLQC